MRIYKIKKQIKSAQDFGGFYQGSVPEYGSQFLGTSSVDASQISGMFNKVDDAIQLVNQFNSSLLQNVSFIFNFSKGGAYGVYLPGLDKAIKTEALKKRLEGMGYQIEIDDKGLLTARPTSEEKPQEQIQQDIDNLYNDLESKGGSAFGINMGDVLNASKQDATATQSPDPNIWEWMALLHLGATIVHEAVHAQGNEGEAESESAENSFMTWALPIINERYQSSLESQGNEEWYTPLQITGNKRSAQGKNWYKVAQLSHYFPPSMYERPSGSDLTGRFPVGIQTERGMSSWSMMAQEDQNIPLEDRLGRQFMAPIPPDLDQEHDSYEEQLRKYTRDDWKLDPNATTEELLSESHDQNDRAFETIESLLDEKRVKPLILPIKKEASIKRKASINKKATLFGWFNNLEISDGNTIPGLSDRVMSWDSVEESFRDTEKEIRQQTRYNPQYDIKGFYYRYIEPRFHPTLWTDLLRDVSGTHPGFAMASKTPKKDLNSDVLRIVSVLQNIKKKINQGNMHSTRLIMTDDILPLTKKIFGKECRVNEFLLGKTGNEKVYSVWISNLDVSINKISYAEKFFNGNEDTDKNMVDDLIGYSSQRNKIIKEILETTKGICKEYGVSDLYLVGGAPRDIVMGKDLSSVEDLDFSASWPDQSIKVGGLLATKLGVIDTKLYHRTMTLSFEYKGVKVEFRGNFSPVEIRDLLRDKGIKTTPFNMDLYNRDFTINMLVYDIFDERIYDPCGCATGDIRNKKIRTFLDPEFVCKENPLIILRALKFKLRYGFEIDSKLEKAMIMNAPLLFKGKYSGERLRIARENVERENRKQSDALFLEYGLEQIKEY